MGLVKSKNWEEGGVVIDVDSILERKVSSWQVTRLYLIHRESVKGLSEKYFFVNFSSRKL